MKFALGLALSLILAGNVKAAVEWMPVMNTTQGRIELAAGSVGHEKTVTFGTFRFTTSEVQLTAFAELSDKACQNGAGSISLFAQNQNPTKMHYEKDATNAGGHIGSILCSAYKYLKKRGEL